MMPVHWYRLCLGVALLGGGIGWILALTWWLSAADALAWWEATRAALCR